MKTLLQFTFFTILLSGINALYAQNYSDDVHNLDIGVPEVAIVDIEGAGSSAIHLGPVAPTEAGIALDFSNQSNSDLWINYSSVKSTQRNPTRTISVAITEGSLPGGVSVSVKAAADAGKGDGAMGNSAGRLILSSTPQDLITGIGSSYTGDGVNKGHNLTYELDLSSAAGSYSSLDSEESGTFYIAYTISDN